MVLKAPPSVIEGAGPERVSTSKAELDVIPPPTVVLKSKLFAVMGPPKTTLKGPPPRTSSPKIAR